MRYTRWTLLLFGAGALIALVLVSANLPGPARTGSWAMAAGLALLPAALFADWWRHRPWAAPAGKPPPRRRPARKRTARGAKPPANRSRRRSRG